MFSTHACVHNICVIVIISNQNNQSMISLAYLISVLTMEMHDIVLIIVSAHIHRPLTFAVWCGSPQLCMAMKVNNKGKLLVVTFSKKFNSNKSAV